MGVVYLGYTSGTPIASGSNIPMTTIIRRHMSDIGTDMYVKGKGYYTIDVDATLASTAGGLATITVYRNGVPIPMAAATETIAADGTTHISIRAVARNTCCDNATITVGYVGPVLTSTYASVIIQDA